MGNAGKTILAFVAYLCLAVVVTYPMITDPTHLIYNHDSTYDSFDFVWNFWWAKKAILELGQNPYYTTYLNYPEGTSLVFYACSWVYNLLSLPVQVLFNDERGQILSYNLIILLSYGLTGLAMFLLVDYFTKSKKAAFVAGLVFAFCSYRLWNMNRLNLLCTEFLIFYILFLVKVVRDRQRKDAVLLGAVLSLTTYSSPTYFTFLTLFTMLYLLYMLYRGFRGDRSLLDREMAVLLGIAATTFLVMTSPYLWQVLIELRRNPGLYPPFRATVVLSTDLLRVFLPDGSNTFYQRIFRLEPYSPFDPGVVNGGSFMGITVFFIALYAVMRERGKGLGFWAFSALCFLVLALGPFLRFAGTTYPVPLPYLSLYRWIPQFRVSRVPSRFIVMVMLSVSVLFGFGVRRLLEKVGKGGWRSAAICTVVGVLVLMENLAVPVGFIRAPISQFRQDIARQEEHFVVVEAPFNTYTERAGMYWQVTHEKPLLVAHVYRATHQSSYVDSSPLLKLFRFEDHPRHYLKYFAGDNRADVIAEDRKRLTDYRVRYIILHKVWLNPSTLKVVDQLLRDYQPLSRTEGDDGKVIVYRFF